MKPAQESRRLHRLAIFGRLRCFLALVLFPLAALFAAPSFAQDKVLFVSTNETITTFPTHAANARAAFQSVAPAGTFVDRSGSLSGATSLTADLANAKILVLVSVVTAINSARWSEITHALESRPDLLVLAFIDGAPTYAASIQNLNTVLAEVNIIKPASWATITTTNVNGNVTAHLNTDSLYAATFIAAPLLSINGEAWGSMSPVPADYALYTYPALGSPPSATASGVYGFFLPQQASNNGQGACLFLVADSTQFSDTHPPQPAASTAIANAFYNAGTDPNGACGQVVANAPDLWPTLTLPSLPVNTASTVTLTVSNADQAASADGHVDVGWPAGSGLDMVSPPASCSNASSATSIGFSCPLSAIAASGSASFTFQVIAPSPVTDVTITAEVLDVTDEINTANNKDELNVSAPGYPDLTSQITGPSSLSVGGVGAYTVTITNQGNLDSSDGTVTINLPADIALNPASLPAHCTVASATITCTLGAIAQGGGTATIHFTARATRVFSTELIDVNVTVVTGEQVTSNNDSHLSLNAVAAAASAQAIPALNEMALALLALLVLGLAGRACQRRA